MHQIFTVNLEKFNIIYSSMNCKSYDEILNILSLRDNSPFWKYVVTKPTYGTKLKDYPFIEDNRNIILAALMEKV
jgi:hypothetical protein